MTGFGECGRQEKDHNGQWLDSGGHGLKRLAAELSGVWQSRMLLGCGL